MPQVQLPAETSLAETSLAEPSLAEPSLAEPSLAEPSLAEPSLLSQALRLLPPFANARLLQSNNFPKINPILIDRSSNPARLNII
jgi:hypothetical protein